MRARNSCTRPMRTPQVSLASPKVKLAGGGDGAQVPGQDGAAVRTFRVLYLDEVGINLQVSQL